MYDALTALNCHFTVWKHDKSYCRLRDSASYLMLSDTIALNTNYEATSGFEDIDISYEFNRFLMGSTGVLILWISLTHLEMTWYVPRNKSLLKHTYFPYGVIFGGDTVFINKNCFCLHTTSVFYSV